MNEAEREALIRQHLDAVRRLEADRGAPTEKASWPPEGYYLLWHVVVGMMIGVMAAAGSLVANVMGAPIFGKHPLELIRVYLTFPMGESALNAETGLLMFVGSLLYLVTGAAFGIIFHLIMSTWLADAPWKRCFVFTTLFGLAIWIINFYGILSWLQPLLLGGNWIVELVPFWVAALTHLAFAWSMFLLESWGVFVPDHTAAHATEG